MPDFFTQQRQANQQLMNQILPYIIKQRLDQQAQQQQMQQIQPILKQFQQGQGQQGGFQFRPTIKAGPVTFTGISPLEQQREERIRQEQLRRQERFRYTQMLSQGGGVGEDQLLDFQNFMNFDLRPQLEAGRGEPYIDPSTGRRRWRVLSDNEWSNKVTQGKFSPTEIEHLQTMKAEHRAWQNVLQRLQQIDISPATIGKMSFQTVQSPIGPLSLPARFNLIGQYNKDPRYTAVKRDIELAFQHFRKRVTGAQASDRELRMLRPLLADLRDRPEVFFATINNALQNVEIAFNDRMDIYQRAGRNISKFQNFFQQPNQQMFQQQSQPVMQQPNMQQPRQQNPRAVNPQTGEVLELINNRWQKVK